MFAGSTTSEYFFSLPTSIKDLIKQFDAQGIEVNLEVIQYWRYIYATSYSDPTTTEISLQKTLRTKILTLALPLIVLPEQVNIFSTDAIVNVLMANAVADKASTGDYMRGPFQDILNPLYLQLTTSNQKTAVIDVMELAIMDVVNKLNSTPDISTFEPPDLRSKLSALGITADEVNLSMTAYEAIRSRFVQYIGVRTYALLNYNIGVYRFNDFGDY